MQDQITQNALIVKYLNLQNFPKEDVDLILSDVNNTLYQVIIVTILENLTDENKKKFLDLVKEANKNSEDRKWLDFAEEKIPKLSSFVETAYMDALQRIKLGF